MRRVPTLSSALALCLTLSGTATGASPAASPLASVPPGFATVRTLEPEQTGIGDPLDIAVGPDGNLYVLDRPGAVVVVGRDGTPVRRWGEPGTEEGRIGVATGGAIGVATDGSVLLAEGDAKRVSVFSADGGHLRSFGAFGTEVGQFLIPFAVTPRADGGAYVVDDGAGAIISFDAQGTELWRVGGPDETRPELRGHFHPGGIGAAGEVWYANDDALAIVALDADGQLVDSFPVTGAPPFPGPCGMARDSEGRVAEIDCSRRRLQLYAADGSLLAALVSDEDLPFGTSFVFGPDDLLYVLEGGNLGGAAPTGTPGRILVLQPTP